MIPETNGDARIAALQQELRAKEEHLQTAQEELETSNEELKSSNEEMQSVNEELQSTNEELETSKEELQSVNEELSTVNAELQSKLADFSRANNDMNNLLAGTGIGTVFVDHQLRILRFTPAATRIINLIPSDVGRPVSHIMSNLAGYDNLTADVQSVLNNLIPKEVEVQAWGEEWYSMRILPYRTQDNVIEGAVITFVDISAGKRASEELARIVRRNQEILENLAGSFISLDDDMVITYINPAAERVLRRKAAGLIGRPFFDALPEMQRQVFEESFLRCKNDKKSASFKAKVGAAPSEESYDVHMYPESGGGIALLLQAITHPAGETLHGSEPKFRVMYESMPCGVVFHGRGGRIMDANPAAARILRLSREQMLDLETSHLPWKTVHTDGSVFPHDEHPAQKAFRTGQEVRDAIMGLQPADGAKTIWVRISAIPQFEKGEGTPYQVYTIFEDITGSLSPAKGSPAAGGPPPRSAGEPLDQEEE